MEYALRDKNKKHYENSNVLILVLMEYALRERGMLILSGI